MKYALLIVWIALASSASGQNPNALIRSGNEAYIKGSFDDAEVAYSEALRADGALAKARFNLGDALFRQERLDDALAEFQTAAEISDDPDLRAKSYHNIGNIHAATQQWDQAVEAYKQSLRANPTDGETRHNLAYAQQQLKQQQQQEKDKDKNEQNENKDQQNDEQQEDQQQQQEQQDQQEQQQQQQQDQEQEQKDQQQQQQQHGEDEQKQQPQEGEQQPIEGQISREEALRLLEALQQQEQQVQEKLKKEKVKAKKTKKEKDW
ncbi:MAG: tetratricopeptide repeat protein [Flavobacteriales bacterium]|nr:tetratricopeptide repeat protein [Flavobacteriales bacterium]